MLRILASTRSCLVGIRMMMASNAAQPKILTINAWNEWSYLEPDTVTGMAYQEGVRYVFGVTSH